MSRRISAHWALASLFIGVCTTGCYYNALGDTSQLDTIATLREPDRDFEELGTFAMPDEVADLSDLVDGGRDIDDDYFEDITRAVARNMAELGWERIVEAEDADVVILNGVVASDNWVYYNWWWGYYPYYVYYPSYTTTVNFPTGSIITAMIKPDEMDMEEDMPVVPTIWVAGIRGLLSGSVVSPEARIENAIDQAFVQSPYLEVGDAVDPVYDIGIEFPEEDAGDGGSDSSGDDA